MAVIPTSILLLTALAISSLWNRSSRMLQGIGVVGISASSVYLFIAASSRVDSAIRSTWAPAGLFGVGIELQLNEAVWPMAMLSTALLLAAVISDVGTNARPSALGIAIGGLAIAAAFAANMQTMILAWTGIAILRLLRQVNSASLEESSHEKPILIGREGIAVVALLGSAYWDALSGGAASLSAPMGGITATALFLAAVLILSGSGDEARRIGDQPEEPSAGHALIPLLPAAAAVAALGSQMAVDLPAGALPWVRTLGIAGLGWGVSGFLTAPSVNIRRARLNLSLASLGILSASVASPVDHSSVIGSAGLILVVGGLVALAEARQKWQRAWPVLAGLLLAGIPGTPGNVLMQALAAGLKDRHETPVVVVVLLAIAVLCASLWREGIQESSPRPRRASGKVLASDVGLLLLMATVGGVSVHRGWFGDIPSTITMLGVAAAGAALSLFERRWPRLLNLDRWTAPLAAASQNLEAVLLGALDGFSAAIRSLTGVIEGAGAVLWMFLAVLLALLASGVGVL